MKATLRVSRDDCNTMISLLQSSVREIRESNDYKTSAGKLREILEDALEDQERLLGRFKTILETLA